VVSFGVDPLPLFVVQRVPMGYQLLTVTANGNDPAGPRVFSGIESDNRNAECDQRSVTKMPGLYHRPSKYSRTAGPAVDPAKPEAMATVAPDGIVLSNVMT
jgi:hypothetical protein